MNNIEFFKLSAKNLLKDFKTRRYNKSGKCYEYTPKYFDIGGIFFNLDIPDTKDDFSFTLMNAQHLIAKLVGFEKWDNLIHAPEPEQDSARKKLEYIKQDFHWIVKQKSYALGFGEPIYRAAAYQDRELESLSFDYSNLSEMALRPPIGFSAKNPKTGFYDYSVKIGSHFFVGNGKSLRSAMMAADKKAYQFLCQEEAKRLYGKSTDEPIEESKEWAIPVMESAGFEAYKNRK